MIISHGRSIAHVKSVPTTVWAGSPSTWPPSLQLSGRWSSYAAIYRQQLWVYVVVNKLAGALARLPLKVYLKDDNNRPEAVGNPYQRLLAKPNSRHSPFDFWTWVDATKSVYGEAFLGKVRDRGGRPVELLPLHPTGMRREDDGTWEFRSPSVQIHRIPAADLLHFRTFNPDDDSRGLSPLEPLRATLENEDAARRATAAFWRNGGRPSVILRHPQTLKGPAADRLKSDWDRIHGSVDNFGKAALLEEGMEAQVMQLNAEELQYIDTRKLNREEVVAAFDVPPPVVHILDRATFSNITEQMRSMYRDTMGPRLGFYEAALDTYLRGALNPATGEPDFGGDVYAEFLLDEILRGDFEQRAEAYQKAINSGWLMPSEVRRYENLPEVEGADRLLVNTALAPLSAVEAPAPAVAAPALSDAGLRSVMGRLSRVEHLADMHPGALVAGLNGSHKVVLAELEAAKSEGLSVAEFRDRLKQLAGA